MVNTIRQYSGNIYSQNGEDFVIHECFRRLGIITGHVTEIGANDGYFCSNTRLWIDRGFTATLVEADRTLCNKIPKKDGVEIVNAFVTADNVNDLCKTHSVLWSCDTDTIDLEIWNAYTGTPDIVIIEINSSLPPDAYFYEPDKGANFTAMNLVAEAKGYFLLCHTGNCIYIRKEHEHLFPDADPTFKTDWL